MVDQADKFRDEDEILSKYLRDNPELAEQIPPPPSGFTDPTISPGEQASGDPFEAMKGEAGSVTIPPNSPPQPVTQPVGIQISEQSQSSGMTASEKLDRIIDLLDSLPRNIVAALRDG